jgi:hypothetical protein
MHSLESVQELIKNIVRKSPSKASKSKIFKNHEPYMKQDKSDLSGYGAAMRNESTAQSPNMRLNESSSIALLDNNQ